MSDLKLFKIDNDQVRELSGEALQVERSLQLLFEANLEPLLGIRFLTSEHSTGPVHGGRIDTLGLDEDDCPVILEFKRAVNENVINQGLFYLDWLLDHRKEFQWLVMEKLGAEIAGNVDWSAPRLICIAGDFTRYDQHAVKQIARNIELIRYRRFDSGLLMLELVHAPKQARPSAPASPTETTSTPPFAQEALTILMLAHELIIGSQRPTQRYAISLRRCVNIWSDWVMTFRSKNSRTTSHLSD
jgi:hypothetical protein